MDNFEVTNNEKQMQFQVHTDGEIASLQYRFYKKDIAMMHTEVPDRLSGKGIASALAHYALEWAKEHNKKVMVYCPFVAAYLKKHPQYDELVDKNYR
ncbi:MAG: N-acetyltransferase [Segetibacter sp.]|nr:N-acetyltransferase [Segetibacter sp.]